MTSAYLYAAARTPFGRFAGALAGIRPDDLAATALTGVLAKARELAPEALRDDEPLHEGRRSENRRPLHLPPDRVLLCAQGVTVVETYGIGVRELGERLGLSVSPAPRPGTRSRKPRGTAP